MWGNGKKKDISFMLLVILNVFDSNSLNFSFDSNKFQVTLKDYHIIIHSSIHGWQFLALYPSNYNVFPNCLRKKVVLCCVFVISYIVLNRNSDSTLNYGLHCFINNCLQRRP